MSTCRHLVRILGVAGGPVRPSQGTAWSTAASSPLGGSSARFFTMSAHSRAKQRQARPQRQKRQQPSPQEEEKRSVAELVKERKFGLVGAGIAAAVLGGYMVMVAISIFGAPPSSGEDDRGPSGRPLELRQGKISATAFDRDLNQSETIMGVKGLRELMGGLARGHVLEVAVGTGRNIEYIDWDEIRASAPPIVTDTEDRMREVSTEEQLDRERRLRRIEKGKRGMLLPGDEAPEVLSYTGVDVSTDVLEVAWVKLKKVLPELVPRRKRQSKEEGVAQQPVQQQRENQQSGPVTSWLGNIAAAVAPNSSSTTTTPLSSTPSSSLQEEEMILAANLGQGRIRLYKSDAQTRLPPPPARSSHDGSKTLPAPAYYDTILQNFGLCSVSDPQRMLANMAALLQPASGRIYLLEHGRGWYDWLNGLLDKFAPAHFRKYGCWWNRDIEAIVRKAEEEVPGLEVVRIDRPLLLQGGTMLWIELKVNPDKISKTGGEIGRG